MVVGRFKHKVHSEEIRSIIEVTDIVLTRQKLRYGGYAVRHDIFEVIDINHLVTNQNYKEKHEKITDEKKSKTI